MLLAEDEDDIRMLISYCLESIGGFEILECENGEDIVEKAIAFSPDIISLDVMMPKVGGLEALENLRNDSRLDNTPIVLVTAKAMDTELQDYVALKVEQVITKPFQAMELPDMFKNIIEQFKATH